MYKILVIDDDPGYLKSVENFLSYKKYKVHTISNPLTVIEVLKEAVFDCILCDVKMPAMDGVALLKHIQKQSSFTPVIMVSGQSTISIAVDAIRQGAYDFVEKAADTDRLLITIENAIAKKSWIEEKENLLSELSENFEMVGRSPLMLQLFEQIRKVAPTTAKVLILGETGTGKELVARAIHFNSLRRGKPFIKVNCAAIPDTLLESELFGYKRGSFTGAIQDKTGKFQTAHEGTLFLDEIGDLNPLLQAKLLRVLQDNEIEVIGENQPRIVDVRVICATNKDLDMMVAEGRFREDLYHRINVVCIQIPSLDQRKDDIPLLAHHFLHKNAESYNKTLTDISPQALADLMERHWPGNVRELKNLIEKICIFSTGPIIKSTDISNALGRPDISSSAETDNHSLKQRLEKFERQCITQALDLHDGKMNKTAEFLDIDRTTLFKKMQKYDITRSTKGEDK